MSFHRNRFDSSSSDEDNLMKISSSSKTNKNNFNEALVSALKEAMTRGVGDEDCEVLPPPPSTFDPSKINNEETPNHTYSSLNYEEKMEEKEDDLYNSIGTIFLQKSNDLTKEEEIEFLSSNPIPNDNLFERSKYIPLRLSYEERKSLRLISSILNISNYTNMVDNETLKKNKRKHLQIQSIVSILSSIIISLDYNEGQNCLSSRNFSEYENIYQSLIEIFRRYKIINPDKLRNEYGKLIYFLQDTVNPEIQELVQINLIKPIETVYTKLSEKNCLDILNDPLISVATTEILPDSSRSRHSIQQDIKKKEFAIKELVKKYKKKNFNEDEISLILYSLNDNNSYLNYHLKPIFECLNYLKKYFHPSVVEAEYSLAINEGNNGSRLSHNHEVQYYYVFQTLILWSEIMKNFFSLWFISESDLLNPANKYDYVNTGQGFHRLQASPKLYKIFYNILVQSQEKIEKLTGKEWIGTKIIHLGDHNVPNALIFIDKYTQITKILNPVLCTLKNLESIIEKKNTSPAYTSHSNIDNYIKSNYQNSDTIKKVILSDFFKSGFDGSGGDNFFDAGSCIDGRLTSAWNWCSNIDQKPYYNLFKLAGFSSFDGEFDS